MSLTKTDLDQIVKALDPKFKDMNLEIGAMFRQLATKDELHQEISRLDDRIDQFEDRFGQFAGSMRVFQSRVTNRFNNLDEKLQQHDAKFEQIIQHVGGHNEQLRTHDRRITALEAK